MESEALETLIKQNKKSICSMIRVTRNESKLNSILLPLSGVVYWGKFYTLNNRFVWKHEVNCLTVDLEVTVLRFQP